MGQYDVKLQKTSLGYQFDRNVFIGFQTHDNRVVTFKDLKDITVASSGGGGGGGGDLIELEISNIDTVDSSSLGDRLIFKRNNVEEAAFDILPQYVRSAGDASEEQILDSDSKMCLLIPVLQDGETVGYQIYTTDVAVSEWSKIKNRPDFVQNVQLQWGTAVTYATQTIVSGSASSTQTYSITLPAISTLPTLPVSAVSITNTIASHSTDIPTSDAVYNFASSAGSLKLTASTNGYLVGVTTQPSSSTQTLAPVGSSTVQWNTDSNNETWLSANLDGKLKYAFTVGGIEFNGATNKTVGFGNGLTVAISGTTATVSLNASLATVTLNWESAVEYGSIGGNTYTISMPPVSTLPTLPVSAVDITTSVTSGSSLKIPTEGAVYNAITTAVPNIVAGTNIATSSSGSSISIAVKEPFAPNDVTVNSSIIVPTITSTSDTNAAAHKGYVDNVKGYVDNVTLTVSGTTVTFTAADGTSTSFDIASNWEQLATKPTFHNAVLSWGTPTKYVDVPTGSSSSSFNITLPAVSQLPTLPVSALNIVSSLTTEPSDSAIPTALAVWNLAHDAGKVQSITVGTHNYTPNSNGVVSLPTYPKSVTLAYGTTRTYAKDDDGNDVSIELPKPGWSDVTGKPTLSISGNTITIGNDSTTWTNTTYTNGAQISIGSNNAINHNTISGVSTTISGVYEIQVDGYGHISSRGTDRITSMPASDVQEWAKALTKPTYAWGEIYNKPTEFPPSSHTHSNFSIQIGNSTTTYNGGSNQSIVLATLPTLSVSTMDVITSLSNSASDSQVATAKAIWSALGGKPFNQLYSWDASSGTLLIDIS